MKCNKIVLLTYKWIQYIVVYDTVIQIICKITDVAGHTMKQNTLSYMP